MRDAFSEKDYGVAGFGKSYWAANARAFSFDAPRQKTYDLIIIGSGYTGLNAAITCASKLSTLIIDANEIATGCSSRNGGDLCLGGSFLSEKTINRRYGALKEWMNYQLQSIEFVKNKTQTHGIILQGQSEYEYLTRESEKRKYSRNPNFYTQIENLPHPTFGILKHQGYGLNARRYSEALMQEAQTNGAEFLPNQRVNKIQSKGGIWHVLTRDHEFHAERILVATNGYSQNGIHPALNNLVLPLRSHIIVTKPIAEQKLEAMNWRAHHPLYDSRTFLHYFRLLPDDRILFGMRGDFAYEADQNFHHKVKADFDKMFPDLSDVEVEYSWSGLIAATRRQHPFIGNLAPNLFASFGYHGNGIALGSFSGHQIGKRIAGETDEIPAFLGLAAKKFPNADLSRFFNPFMFQYYRFKEGAKLTPL